MRRVERERANEHLIGFFQPSREQERLAENGLRFRVSGIRHRGSARMLDPLGWMAEFRQVSDEFP